MYIALETVNKAFSPEVGLFKGQIVLATFVRQFIVNHGYKLLRDEDVNLLEVSPNDPGDLASRDFATGFHQLYTIIEAQLFSVGADSRRPSLNLYPYIPRFFGTWENFETEVRKTIGQYKGIVNSDVDTPEKEKFFEIQGRITRLIGKVGKLVIETDIQGDEAAEERMMQSVTEFSEELASLLVKEQCSVQLAYESEVAIIELMNRMHETYPNEELRFLPTRFGDVETITNSAKFPISTEEVYQTLKSDAEMVEATYFLTRDFPLTDALYMSFMIK